MTSAPDAADLLAAKRLLAEAERAAIDEVLALRSAAAELYGEVVAMRADAARLVEQAAADAERVQAEHAALEARSSDLDARGAALDARSAALEQQALSVVAPHETGSAASAPPGALEPGDGEAVDGADPVVGAQAEMRALTALLDELQGRVEVLGQASRLGDDPP